jgi:tetratricopeptide (TPR) repeat protein
MVAGSSTIAAKRYAMHSRARWSFLAKSALWLLLAAGCALYSDVTISPLLVIPSNLERGSDIRQMIDRADYLRAIALAPLLEERSRKTAGEMAALGEAELAAGRYDAARRHLRQALDLNPHHTMYAEVAWNLSQLEFLQNNFEASREWADLATERGLPIKQWHVDYLTALARNHPYIFSGAQSDHLALHFGDPDVPRVEVHINQEKVRAIIDSGAVTCVVSERFAAVSHIRSLGDFHGTFFGLLNEPIDVRFGMIDRLEMGKLVVENVPVSIMKDDKMSFVISERRPFNIDVLLGSSLLKEFRTELDFRHRKATFTRLMAEDRRSDPDQNLFFDGFRPFVRATINKHGWFMFVLDTGSEITFLNDAHLGMLPLSSMSPRMHGATLQGLGGSKKRGAKLENIEIGVDKWSGSFRTLPTYTTEKEKSVGIIGENFLKNFRLVLDFGRMRVDLIRERGLI